MKLASYAKFYNIIKSGQQSDVKIIKLLLNLC